MKLISNHKKAEFLSQPHNINFYPFIYKDEQCKRIKVKEINITISNRVFSPNSIQNSSRETGMFFLAKDITMFNLLAKSKNRKINLKNFRMKSPISGVKTPNYLMERDMGWKTEQIKKTRNVESSTETDENVKTCNLYKNFMLKTPTVSKVNIFKKKRQGGKEHNKTNEICNSNTVLTLGNIESDFYRSQIFFRKGKEKFCDKNIGVDKEEKEEEVKGESNRTNKRGNEPERGDTTIKSVFYVRGINKKSGKGILDNGIEIKLTKNNALTDKKKYK